MYCQECRTPLKLDGSLNELNPAAFKLLAEAGSTSKAKEKIQTQQVRPSYSSERREEYARAAKNAKAPTFKRSVGSGHHGSSRSSLTAARDGVDMSFIMLTDSQVMPSASGEEASPKPPTSRRRSMHQPKTTGDDDSMSNRMETTARLFEILSARSDIDHPICVECTERLVEQLQKRLGNASRERDAYVEFLRQANADVPTDEELQQARAELEQIQQQERAAFAELEQLESEKAALELEMEELDSQSRDLDIQEEQFWAERNDFSQKLSALQNERERLDTQFEHDSKQLERLRRANVYNDTFSIGHDGYFGTINGLRLGRLPDRAVDWSEINAAWGHTCLLLATVADKLGFKFKGHELLPMGSTSRIRVYKAPRTSTADASTVTVKPQANTYKLYYSGDALSTLSALFHSEFDTAMIAFLECLKQLIQHARTLPGCPRIAYKIERDRIEEHSIKLSGLGAQEQEWTKACKQCLICCKILLACASNVVEAGRKR